jgi:hypothetical protein
MWVKKYRLERTRHGASRGYRICDFPLRTHTLSSSLSILHVSTDNAGGGLGLVEVSSLVGVVGHIV